MKREGSVRGKATNHSKNSCKGKHDNEPRSKKSLNKGKGTMKNKTYFVI